MEEIPPGLIRLLSEKVFMDHKSAWLHLLHTVWFLLEPSEIVKAYLLCRELRMDLL